MLLSFPVSLAEAQQHIAEGAVPTGGGTLLWADWQLHGFPKTAVSLRDLPEANVMGAECVGAAVPLARVDSTVPRALRQAAASVGNAHLRLTATVGGNLAGTGPRCLLPALLALEARALVLGHDGVYEQDLALSLTEHRPLISLRWHEPVASASRKLDAGAGAPPPVVAAALHAPDRGEPHVRVAVRVGHEVLTARVDAGGGIGQVLDALRTSSLAAFPAELRDGDGPGLKGAAERRRSLSGAVPRRRHT